MSGVKEVTTVLIIDYTDTSGCFYSEARITEYVTDNLVPT